MPVGDVESVKDEISEAKDVSDWLQLPAGYCFLKGGFVVESVDFLFSDEIDGCAKEAASAGGRIEHLFAQARAQSFASLGG